jgi:hypothetical protein
MGTYYNEILAVLSDGKALVDYLSGRFDGL